MAEHYSCASKFHRKWNLFIVIKNLREVKSNSPATVRLLPGNSKKNPALLQLDLLKSPSQSAATPGDILTPNACGSIWVWNTQTVRSPFGTRIKALTRSGRAKLRQDSGLSSPQVRPLLTTVLPPEPSSVPLPLPQACLPFLLPAS